MEGFKTYLSEKAEASTIKRYVREAIAFENVYETNSTSYTEISKYFNLLRNNGYSEGTLGAVKAGLKSYFNYLIFSGQRVDNPVKLIEIKKGSREIDFESLLTTDELDSLIRLRKERYSLLKYRNLLIISLCRYQGLTRVELVNLNVDDYDFDTGQISIGATTGTNSRALELKPTQVGYLMKYLTAERPNLIKVDTEKLLITKLGTHETGDGITYIFETLRKHFPNKKINLKEVRKAVIAEKCRDVNDLRRVQYFAGHKYTSTTEKYIKEDEDELFETIELYHPYRQVIS